MSEKSDDGIFSDAYWNMHRNSLFFSLIALIFSLPGVRVSTAIPTFGIGEIDDNSSKFIVFIFLGVALYSVSIFTLEWRQQALPYLRKRTTYFSDRREFDQSNLSALQSTINQIPPLLDDLNRLIPEDVNTLEGDFEERPRSMSERTHESTQYVIAIQKVLTERNEYSANEAIGTIRKSIDDETTRQIDFIRHQQSRRRIQNVIRESHSILYKSNEIISRIDPVGLIKWIKLRALHYNISLSADVIRIMALGLALPWVMFATALLHFVGKSYFHIVPAINRLISQ